MSTRDQIIKVVNGSLKHHDYPELEIINNIIPDDKTTLFVCSGMQNLKPRFESTLVDRYSSIQKCIRLQDIELVGDSSHISSFEMIGSFGFNTSDYGTHISIWDKVLYDLGIKKKVTHVTFHEDSNVKHKQKWEKLGYNLIQDNNSCYWSDGNIGGYCFEVFIGDLEIGNLVNPLKISTDVGFGMERLVSVLENKPINETSLFDPSLDPLSRDYIKTLRLLRDNNIQPGAKGPHSICKKLVRTLLKNNIEIPEFSDWFSLEKILISKKEDILKKEFCNWNSKPESYWFETFGITTSDYEDFKLKFNL